MSTAVVFSALLLALGTVVHAQIDIDWDLIAKYKGTTESEAKVLHKPLENSFLPYAALHMGHDDTPWMGDTQLISVDPLSGLFIWRLRSRAGYVAPLHRHYGEVYAVTEEGCWGYIEHPEWLACDGDVVHETPGSVHTYYIPPEQQGNTTIVIMTWGALENLDSEGHTTSIADWRTMALLYEAYCQATGEDCPDPVRHRYKQETPLQKACPNMQEMTGSTGKPVHDNN